MNSTELKAKIAKTDSFSTKVRYILTKNEKLCWVVGLSLYAIIVFWAGLISQSFQKKKELTLLEQWLHLHVLAGEC